MKIKELGIEIVYKPLKDSLGYFDEKTGQIVINSKQSKSWKDVILIHEFLHLTASSLKRQGIIKRQPDHDFITNASQQLLACFVLSGKWKDKHKITIK